MKTNKITKWVENVEKYLASHKEVQVYEKPCRRDKLELAIHEHELNSHFVGKNTAICECSMRSIIEAYNDSREVW